MAWYQEINVVQEPMDIGLDEHSRPMWAFNITAVKSYSKTFLEEIVSILETATVGTFGVDISHGKKHVVPEGAGPFLSIIQTGGTTPLRTHNEITTPAYQRPAAQLVARAATTPAALAMAQDAYEALVGIRNVAVTP
jgi:hypothetical protein